MWVGILDQFLSSFIVSGSLEIVLPDGQHRRYGDGTAPVVVHLHDADLPRKLVLKPELAMGEGYMDGTLTIEDDDLEGLFRLTLINQQQQQGTWWWRVRMNLENALRWVPQINPSGRSKSNVAHHYDLSGKLYDLFLDQDRQYSCAYFETGNETLEQAQSAKKALIARKLRLSPGQRVLDIGCGWGGLALTLARDYGVKVLGVTLSEEQHGIATERIASAGLSDQVEIRLTDYRDVRGTFDRIVSVGMFEHVGVPHYQTFFRALKDRLEPDGIALLHTIGRTAKPQRTSPWIRKYIFPGGYVPTMSEISRVVEKELLWMSDIEILRLHYAETLLHWRRRVEENADAVRALYDDRFLRMWRFYLLASESTFRYGRQAVFQIQLTRSVDAAPLTRGYLFEAEAQGDDSMAAQ